MTHLLAQSTNVTWAAVALAAVPIIGAVLAAAGAGYKWLANKFDTMSARQDVLEVRLEECRTGRETLRQQNADQQKQIDELKAENRRLHDEIDALRRPSPPPP